MPLTITPPPVTVFVAATQAFGRELIHAAAEALREDSEVTMTLAKERTPVRFGVLRGSGTVFPTEVSGTVLTSRLGFGGAAKEYAIPVHENLTARHAVGQAKFLECAMLERARGQDRRLAEGIRRRMGR